MNVAACHFSYLANNLAVPIRVARTPQRSGRVFLIDAFDGNAEPADSADPLLVAGFSLINAGFIALALKTADPLRTRREVIELEMRKAGVVLPIVLPIVLLTMGAVTFFKMLVPAKMRRNSTDAAVRG